jgi:hypothetical protein
MKYTKFFLSAIIFVLVSISIMSCDPTQKQLEKEKIRTQETVKVETETLKTEILNVRNELKLIQLKSDLALNTYKLESLQKPKEFKTQTELANEIDELSSKIETINAEISATENLISSSATK